MNEYSDYEVQALFHECSKAPEGCAINIAKVVGKARDVHCSIRIHQAALEAQKTLPPAVESIIAINTTDPGKYVCVCVCVCACACACVRVRACACACVSVSIKAYPAGIYLYVAGEVGG